MLDTEFLQAEYLFRLRGSTNMFRLMEAYCARIGKETCQRSFYFDSRFILPDDTANTLGMHRPGFAYLVISAPPLQTRDQG